MAGDANLDPSSRHVGFYGCDVDDRIVRVGLTTSMSGMQITAMRRNTWNIDCPCGRTHKRKIMWRRRKYGEKLNAEVMLRAEDGIAPPKRRKGDPTRFTV